MSEYKAFNLVRRVEQPTYTIKPPVWEGNTTRTGSLSACVLSLNGTWSGYFSYSKLSSSRPIKQGSAECADEAAARDWCEQRYYEWVRQFLEEVKT